MLTFYGTCINVLLVAVDRFVATRFAVSATIRLTTTRCRIICGVSWFYMVLLCLVPFLPLQRLFRIFVFYLKWKFWRKFNFVVWFWAEHRTYIQVGLASLFKALFKVALPQFELFSRKLSFSKIQSRFEPTWPTQPVSDHVVFCFNLSSAKYT